jgi:hypothetical protein
MQASRIDGIDRSNMRVGFDPDKIVATAPHGTLAALPVKPMKLTWPRTAALRRRCSRLASRAWP